jgi:tetratricopeptide (TPR) repeat protein
LAEAEGAYRAAYALEPRMERALSAIPHLRRQTADDNLIAPLRAAFDAAGDDEGRRLHLGHALAKSLEDLGEFEEAMAVLAQAKQAGRARAVESQARNAALFEAAARTSAPGPGGGAASERPVFVFGLPRTGTTLTDRILSSHPEVASAGELGAFGLLVKRAARTPSRFVLDADTLDAAAALDLAPIGEGYLAAAPPHVAGAQRFVDKMPLNFFYAGLIHRALPNARMICLRRDPMDSCLSNYRQLLATGPSNYDYTLDLEAAARYYAGFDRLMAHWRAALPAGRFLEVRYEDIVADLEGQARRMVEFIGLPWDARCLSFHENAAPVATASSVQVRSPLYASSVGRWKRYGEAVAPLRRALEAEGVRVDD